VTSGLYQYDLAAADFDGDGFADLVLSGGSWSNSIGLSIYPSNGDGTFGNRKDFLVKDAGIPMIFDFNGDGQPDVLTLNESNSFSLLFSSKGTNPPMAVSMISLRAIVPPGSLAILSGSGFTESTAQGDWAALPSALAGVQLVVRDALGNRNAAGLVNVSPEQITFRVPPNTAMGLATLELVRSSGTTIVGRADVRPVAPTLLTMDVAGTLAALVFRQESNGAMTPVPAFQCDGGPACRFILVPVDQRPVYLTAFGTGFGTINPADVEVQVTGPYGDAGYVIHPESVGPVDSVQGVDQVVVKLTRQYDDVDSIVVRVKGQLSNEAQTLD